MRKLFAYLITFYQKRISLHKGFCCAHRGLHRGDSCSEYTKKQILEKGLFVSLKSIKQRFIECSDAAQIIQKRPPLSQRGDCDIGLGYSCYLIEALLPGSKHETPSKKTNNLYDLISTAVLAFIFFFFLLLLLINIF